MTPEEIEGARDQFAAGKACPHCGGLHLRACPRVRRLVFRKIDEIGEVEFWPHGTWPEDEIVWPEDVYDAEVTDGVQSRGPDHPAEAGEAGEAEEAIEAGKASEATDRGAATEPEGLGAGASLQEHRLPVDQEEASGQGQSPAEARRRDWESGWEWPLGYRYE